MTDPLSHGPARTLVFGAISGLLALAACSLDAPLSTAPNAANDIEVTPQVEQGSDESSMLAVGQLHFLPGRDGGSLSGSVLNRTTREPMKGVQVLIPSADRGGLTNTDGRFLIAGLPPGDHTVAFRHPELGETTIRVVWTGGEEMAIARGSRSVDSTGGASPDLPMRAAGGGEMGVVTGTVVTGDPPTPVGSAQVSFPALEIGGLTAVNGRFLILNVPAGTHLMRVDKEGFPPVEMQVEVTAGERTAVDVEMR